MNRVTRLVKSALLGWLALQVSTLAFAQSEYDSSAPDNELVELEPTLPAKIELRELDEPTAAPTSPVMPVQTETPLPVNGHVVDINEDLLDFATRGY